MGAHRLRGVRGGGRDHRARHRARPGQRARLYGPRMGARGSGRRARRRGPIDVRDRAPAGRDRAVAPYRARELLRRTGSRDEAERLYRAVAWIPSDARDRPRCLEFPGGAFIGSAVWRRRSHVPRLDGRCARTALGAVRSGAVIARERAIRRGSRAYGRRSRPCDRRDTRRLRAPLTVAVEDLEDAVEVHPDLAVMPAHPGDPRAPAP